MTFLLSMSLRKQSKYSQVEATFSNISFIPGQEEGGFSPGSPVTRPVAWPPATAVLSSVG